MAEKPSKGLADVVAASTALSDIDGRAGRLSYRGYDINQLAGSATFEETSYLLQRGSPPSRGELAGYRGEIAAGRALGKLVTTSLPEIARSQEPMEAMRSLVSLASADDPDKDSNEPGPNMRKAARLTAQQPVLVAAYDAARRGRESTPSDPELAVAANFLLQITGTRPSERETQILDTCLVLHADHTMNASTFAARVCAATLSDMHSAVVAALGTLKGPLHGGANEATMKLLYAIEAAGADAAEYVKQMFAEKKKISGFGHRVYHTEDPRATHLRRMSEDLGKSAGNTKWFDMSRKIELYVKEEKKLNANVDFYSASTYTTLGIDIDLFTPIFAVSRIAGWAAHVIEQHDDNRLIRPRADYVGPPYPSPYIPIAQR